jgi:hypothetical protein
VGRTNVTLLVMGGLAVVALGLMMQYSLRVQRERHTDPVVQELMDLYGPSLDGETRIAYVPGANGPRAVLDIHPRLDVQSRSLARQMGEHVWRALRDGGLAAVEVVCHGLGGELEQRFEIPRPYMTPR